MKEILDLDKKLFLVKFEKIQERFYQKLLDYIKNPSDENIHDIRVTIRRLETAYKILPNNVRKKEKNTNYVKQAKTLFKLNAKIRDYDIICAKMESKYQDQTYELVATLKNFRIEKLHSANEIALKILHTTTPKISTNIIRESKLNKRYFKILGKMELDIQKNTIIALGDEKKIEELHMLRKDFKKLRYSFELVSCKGKTVQILKNLKEIQDMLGDIHDSDIIIDYLRSIEQNSKYLDIIESEVSERRKKYNEFVSAFKKIIPKAGYF
ncbi:CHAD domain-containing protein [Candidatus Nitrosotalea bavarica]|uniref:CHAD domain-containing protein n=1 Tax=Candidatus Nitrosotalea bavarica TaxID=1903277 RepID=UPI000C712CBB|nr:CHAD domain-containing protein [Candidatus Nitrosotalea bavarica]